MFTQTRYIFLDFKYCIVQSSLKYVHYKKTEASMTKFYVTPENMDMRIISIFNILCVY